MATTQAAVYELECTTDVTADPIAPDAAPVDETAVAPAPDVESASETVPHVGNAFACVHPTISLRAATDKLNSAAPIIDVQTDIVVRYTDGTVSRVSVAHSQHEVGTNTGRIADALSNLAADYVVRCLVN